MFFMLEVPLNFFFSCRKELLLIGGTDFKVNEENPPALHLLMPQARTHQRAPKLSSDALQHVFLELEGEISMYRPMWQCFNCCPVATAQKLIQSTLMGMLDPSWIWFLGHRYQHREAWDNEMVGAHPVQERN